MLKKQFRKYKWLILLMVLVFLANTVEVAREYDKTQLIRFHVLADNDSPRSQQDKLAVKDAVVAFMQEELKDSQNVEESRLIIQADMPQMQKIAEDTLAARGCTDSVQIEYGTYYFPIKYYGAFTLPEGDYEAVRIILGAGEGQNWWCVMFPPMCFTGAGEDLGAYSDCAPKKEIVIKWRAAEWWQEHFGADEQTADEENV